MKKQININIDATKSEAEIWAQIDAAYDALVKAQKPSLWQRIKSWF